MVVVVVGGGGLKSVAYLPEINRSNTRPEKHLDWQLITIMLSRLARCPDNQVVLIGNYRHPDWQGVLIGKAS